MKRVRSELDSDLAEVRAFLHMLEGLGGAGQIEDTIDDRLNLARFDRAVHVLELAARANSDPLRVDHRADQLSDVQVGGIARHKTYDTDRTAKGDSAQGFAEGRPDGFN